MYALLSSDNSFSYMGFDLSNAANAGSFFFGGGGLNANSTYWYVVVFSLRIKTSFEGTFRFPGKGPRLRNERASHKKT